MRREELPSGPELQNSGERLPLPELESVGPGEFGRELAGRRVRRREDNCGPARPPRRSLQDHRDR